jgi:predicted transcriptional regulator
MKEAQSIQGNSQELLQLFKALADANRLKIVGLLALGELSVEQLAGMLDLSPSTVSHHLSKLAEAGLVSACAESYYNIYRLEKANLEKVARLLLDQEELSQAAAGVNLQGYDRKIWMNYVTRDGQLKEIPAQRKKLEAILRQLVQEFQPGVQYSEREVNQILGKFHPDTASLRRELVGYGLLGRDPHGERYWRVATEAEPATSLE